MLKKNKELLISELESAELQEDGSVEVALIYERTRGTMNYSDFRCFCEELIRKIRTG